MSDTNQQPPGLGSVHNALLLIVSRLDQHGRVLAEIHQMVSPPEKGEGESLVDVLGRLAEAVERNAEATEEIGRRLDALTVASALPGGRTQ